MAAGSSRPSYGGGLNFNVEHPSYEDEERCPGAYRPRKTGKPTVMDIPMAEWEAAASRPVVDWHQDHADDYEDRCPSAYRPRKTGYAGMDQEALQEWADHRGDDRHA